MTGSAVETTRLSSTTMKSAIEVIASVQSVFALDPVLSNIAASFRAAASSY